jgi:hypothetical protein
MADHPAEHAAPASLAQQSWWLYERYGQGEIVACAFHLHGELHVPALRAALAAVVQRHDSLRTTFRQHDGQLWQVAAPGPPATVLDQLDVAGPSRPERMQTARALLEQELRRPFNLAAGPLVRASLYTLDPTDHVLVIGLHHIVADGASMAIVLRELGALYEAVANGKPSPLPPAMQYQQFVAWQDRQLRDGVLREQLAYWTSRLATAALHLDLSTNRPSPARLPYRPKAHRFRISQAAATAVRGVVKPHRVTPFMVLMAGLQWLLAGWASTPDVVVCAPAANRVRPGTESVVGLLFNEVLYRGSIHPSMSTAALLGQVRQVAREAVANQEVPLEAILLARGVRLDQAQRGLDYTAWLQVEYEAAYELRLPGCRTTRLDLHGLDASPSDEEHPVDWDPTVSLVLTERTDGTLAARLAFNANLLDERTVRAAAQQYNVLLESMAYDGALRDCWPSWRLA